MTDFFYDGIYGQRNFTSITGVYPSSFLPFTMNNVAILDCYNGLILCWCLGTDGYRYVVYNLSTQELKVLPPRIHSVGEARLGFDSTASSHFHVFEYMEEDGQCMGMDIYSSKTTAWIFKEFNGAKRLSGHFQNQQLCFLTVVCTILGSTRVAVVYLLWIWRERHGGKFLTGRMFFHAPSIKLRVTCVNVLLVVAICLSFQSRSLKTMVLIINGH